MRYIKLIPIVAFLIILSCCKKSTEETALVLSQTEVSEGEPFIAKVVNAPADARFIWQIPYGAGIRQFSSDSSMVKLAFFHLGGYPHEEICVKVVSGADTVDFTTYCSEIKLNAGRFEQPASLPETSVKSLVGDQLTLKPIFFGDSSLSFIVQTANSYSCFNSQILYNNASVANSIAFSFNGVWLRDPCEPLNIPAVSFCLTNVYYTDSTYPVEITFNNKVYKGSLTVSDYQGYFEFHWPYTEGVVIEPKVIDGGH